MRAATDNNTSFHGRLVFEPSLSGQAAVTSETWPFHISWASQHLPDRGQRSDLDAPRLGSSSRIAGRR